MKGMLETQVEVRDTTKTVFTSVSRIPNYFLVNNRRVDWCENFHRSRWLLECQLSFII